MKLIRSILALTAVLSISHSHCTGGIFALPTVLAIGVDFQHHTTVNSTNLMSHDVTACFNDLVLHTLESSADEVLHSVEDTNSDCGSGAPCIRKNQEVLLINKSKVFNNDALHLGTSTNFWRNNAATAIQVQVASVPNEPLFKQAHNHAKQLQKRE